MKEFNLKNNIEACIKVNKNTPRTALTLNFSVTKPEKYAGLYTLITKLMLQGTKKYSSEELATILDENAIDLNIDMKHDYFRFSFVCLNEDFELALSILSDVIQNSTFADLEKEKIKFKGELSEKLDNAKVKLSDLFTKNIYKNHFYGHAFTNTLEDIDKITMEDIKEGYSNLINISKKVLTVVGDVDEVQTEELLNKYLSDIKASVKIPTEIEAPQTLTKDYAEIVKEDAQQAQILQGWHVEGINSEDYPKLMLLNVILGASGLSSRLFLELREKKGLAYTVRTAYENHLKKSVFSIYIGTAPTNIQTSIDGFKVEIDKIKNEKISEEELNNAKNNLIGKRQFLTETNQQQSSLMAYHKICGKSFNFQQKLNDKIHSITPEELQECANKYFTDNSLLAIIRP